MTSSMNVHPDEKWTDVEALLFGERCGCAVILKLTDNTHISSNVAFNLHFGSMEHANEFIGMLQDAINKLPRTCDSCGQEIKKEEK